MKALSARLPRVRFWEVTTETVSPASERTSKILLLFPVIIAMGAGSRMTDSRSQRICKFLGDISFPLYITHMFARYLQMAWKESHEDLPIETHIFVSVSLYLLAILVAYAALKLYDEPVRNWLKEKWLKSGKK